jgi:predicted nucleic acid-binding protein
MIRTFLDAGVIIAAGFGSKHEVDAAWEILTDPEREFWTSPFVEMEVLPHAERQAKPEALALYRGFFAAAHTYTNVTRIVAIAAGELRRTNLSLADALHVAAAHLCRADELVTTEKLSKPMHRNTLVKVSVFR